MKKLPLSILKTSFILMLCLVINLQSCKKDNTNNLTDKNEIDLSNFRPGIVHNRLMNLAIQVYNNEVGKLSKSEKPLSHSEKSKIMGKIYIILVDELSKETKLPSENIIKFLASINLTQDNFSNPPSSMALPELYLSKSIENKSLSMSNEAYLSNVSSQRNIVSYTRLLDTGFVISSYLDGVYHKMYIAFQESTSLTSFEEKLSDVIDSESHNLSYFDMKRVEAVADIIKESYSYWTTSSSDGFGLQLGFKDIVSLAESKIGGDAVATVSPKAKAIIKADVNGAIGGAIAGGTGGAAFLGLGAAPGAIFGACMGASLSSAGEGLWQSIGW